MRPANLASFIAAAFVIAAITALAVLSIGGNGAEAGTGTTHTVFVKNNNFQSSSIQIDPGDTVQWLDGQIYGTHTVTQCTGDGRGCPGGAPGFDSGVKTDPGSAYLTQTFPNEGTFFYRCQVHGNLMRGIITVGSPATPTASPTAPPSPTASPTAAPTATATPAPTLSGRSDVNCDGVTDGDDVLALLLHSADAPPSTGSLGVNGCPPLGSGTGDGPRGDLNCDGLVDARDALVALYVWAGLPVPGLPQGCPGP